jgi:UDP-4-amino-4,6-dideoxy-N-acetyl-beta-L-altrosamine transaminase
MIPYGRQYIDEDDIAAVVETLRSDYLTTGPKVAEFEKAFAEFCGAEFAVSCANGTAALHLAALALELGQGDAVVVPSLTFLATANAVRFTGAEVVFADVDPDTGLMTAAHLEEALTRAGDLNIKAVFPVHLTGECVDLKSLKTITAPQGIKIVADSCHALGGTLHGKPVGACEFEDMACYSFHPVKTMTMCEGGAITTNNKHYAERMRRMRTHGMQPCSMAPEIPSYYEMAEPGYNYRLTDMQCALGLTQLQKLPSFVTGRTELSALYDEKLAGLSPAIKPPIRQDYGQAARHLYAPRFDFSATGKNRATVMEELLAAGIGTQVHYYPVHRQPYYQNRYGLTLPGADRYYQRTLSLPLYYGMQDEDVDKVVNALKALL